MTWTKTDRGSLKPGQRVRLTAPDGTEIEGTVSPGGWYIGTSVGQFSIYFSLPTDLTIEVEASQREEHNMRYKFTVDIQTEYMSTIEVHEEIEAVLEMLRGVTEVDDFEKVEDAP